MQRLLAVLASVCATALGAQEFTTLKGHGGPIMGLAMSPAGHIATASFDNSVGLWAKDGPIWLEGHEAAVTAVAFGPNGQLVTGSDDFTVRLWGDAPQVLGQHQGKVTSVQLSPDGQHVLSASWDGTLRLWPLAGGVAQVLQAPGTGINAAIFGPDGRHIFAATMNGQILRFDRQGSDVPLPLVKHGFGVTRLVAHGPWLAYGAVDGGTRVVRADTGAQLADFSLDRRPVLAMAHHAGTGQLAVGDGHGYIMMLDTRTWRITRDFKATRKGPVWALAFAPDGASIYAGGLDDVAYGWPVALVDEFKPGISGQRSFLRDAETMPNGERQFMRKCSICHALGPGPSRKAGPTLHGLFGRPAGSVPGYFYSPTLRNAQIVWGEDTIDALFDMGPDHYIPGSKMPMQVIAGAGDRADLIAYLKQATKKE